MTANLLAADLNLLVQESRRRNADIKSAAEKSLADLKSISITSEAQLAADLRRKPNFVRPFLLSCASKNPKYAAIAIACLQRLIVSNGLAEETLKDVLDVLRDCTGLGVDIQLRILQVLPSLVQNFADRLTGNLLTVALHICFLLLATKHAVTSNTAAATLQQLVVSVLGKVAKQDTKSDADGTTTEVAVEDGTIPVHSAGFDAYHLLNDLCLMMEGQKPQLLLQAPISVDFGLELLEAMLSNHSDLIATHPELVHILRVRLMPFIIRILSEKVGFPVTVRAMRLLPVVFGSMMTLLATECEMIFGLLNHMLDPDAALPWKRVLCLEVFRLLHADAALIRKIYSNYDEQEGKRNIIGEHLAILVRVAAEKPSIIGLGPQSSIPSFGPSEEELEEQAALQAEGVAATLSSNSSRKASTTPGLSVRFSTLKVACMDQLDKSEPPPLPPAYIYSLVLNCINSFAEGLARFLLPFSVSYETKRKAKVREENEDPPSPKSDETDEKKKPKLKRLPSNLLARVPINPLDFADQSISPQITSAARMVEHCWPALLASCSTYLHAALDPEYYHSLIRAFQKFTQIAGVLRLTTPRDAFLTALGKEAIPLNSLQLVKDETQSTNRTNISGTNLTTRNLLCLRALINLAIALGPILEEAWSIVLETLQQTDLVIGSLTPARLKVASSITEIDLPDHIANEVGAAKLASARMLESSTDLLDEAFLQLCTAIASLIGPQRRGSTNGSERRPMHRQTSSATSIAAETIRTARKDLFAIETLHKVVEHNISRLLSGNPAENGWDIVVEMLLRVVADYSIDASARSAASTVLNNIVATTAAVQETEEKESYRLLGVRVLEAEVGSLYHYGEDTSGHFRKADTEIHLATLEVLKGNLERYGDGLVSGWPEVLKVVDSVFMKSSPSLETRSPKLIRSAFGTLQLCCSDFLASVPYRCFPELLRILQHFCEQEEDFNISLTTTTLFIAISDHAWDEVSLSQSTVQLAGSDTVPFSPAEPSSNGVPLWVFILFTLANRTTDARIQIRHSALHSIFRVLGSAGPKIKLDDWAKCQERLAELLFDTNKTMYEEASNSEDKDSLVVATNETAVLILTNFATMFGSNLAQLTQASGCLNLWEELVNAGEGLLQRKTLAVSMAVYTTFLEVLTRIHEFSTQELSVRAKNSCSKCATLVWNVWQTMNPVRHVDLRSVKFPDNEGALVAYVQCVKALHLLIGKDMSVTQAEIVLDQLFASVTGASPTPFVMDIDTLTTLQGETLDVVRQLCGHTPGLSIVSIATLSKLVALAYGRKAKSIDHKGPTYVALSKSAMDVLRDHVINASKDAELYQGGLQLVLQALNVPISLKYQWSPEGKAPTTWEKATTTVVEVLSAAIPVMAAGQLESPPLWQDVLTLYSSIVHAEMPDSGVVNGQETDVVATTQFLELLVPTLGYASISDAMRRNFAATTFACSIIHEPHPDDIPEPGQEPLDSLRSTHIGRVQAIRPSQRSRMGYLLLDKLFDLVALHDSSAEEVRLAQAAAPYLILRAGLVLKAYILDQPLRGRMPQPISEKEEMLYVLRKLVDLNAEPKAMPDTPGVSSTSKKHLFHLYRFVTKALRIAKTGTEQHDALMEVAEMIADQFGA